MSNQEAITIVLPVYGRSELLEPALASVLALEEVEGSPWRLLIADDGSDASTQQFLQAWVERQGGERVEWRRRPQNLGLFANLNQAINEATTEWVLLLCSDDLLLPTALTRLSELWQQWPEAGLILSSFHSINADGSPRPADSAWHHDQLSRNTALIPPERFVPALLQLGSLNGNLTGMAFSRQLWQQAGPFRADWRHAADWEWLLRACECGPALLNREPIAKVRTHAAQLSNSNRRSGHELQEVAEVVASLRKHPLLAEEPRRHRWAAKVMQHQLWNQLKILPRHGLEPLLQALQPIHRAAGLRCSALALLHSAPQRLQGWLEHRGKHGGA
ncbi:glycosyltransferase [Synechococcus sp. HJ21-Hayes]|uniref:glycosyltransferase family 2 protein n=1 Tax=unclassified Synechococcus TaxID=2626047 RepID=UPI0020CFBE21|nr:MULTISPECIES: glycosyltransferase [unclassified Synechococcus]MCP9830276.1 glycosyltransferase [Synechococcus sp. JJ3a-Johnson]MCP9852999.1 glycosyltransferase [Synechococcus sp. HJ21-Hayes]